MPLDAIALVPYIMIRHPEWLASLSDEDVQKIVEGLIWDARCPPTPRNARRRVRAIQALAQIRRDDLTERSAPQAQGESVDPLAHRLIDALRIIEAGESPPASVNGNGNGNG